MVPLVAVFKKEFSLIQPLLEHLSRALVWPFFSSSRVDIFLAKINTGVMSMPEALIVHIKVMFFPLSLSLNL